jgi:hypothetical protein
MARPQLARYRICAAIALCWLASGTTAPASSNFSLQGNFTASSGAFQDFTFSPLAEINFLTLATASWNGGSNNVGETIYSGGIDSTLTLFDALGPLAFNDDVSPSNRDSLLSSFSPGASYLDPQPAGAYRLRLANFGSSIGDGHWAIDLYNGSGALAITQLASSNSTFKSLTFGGFTADDSASLNSSSGDLAFTDRLSVQAGGTLNLSGGSVTAYSVRANSGDINVTNGADISATDFVLSNGGQATFDGPGTTLSGNGVDLDTSGGGTHLTFRNRAAGTFSGRVTMGDSTVPGPVVLDVDSGATVVAGDLDWGIFGAGGHEPAVYVSGLGSSLTVTGRYPMRIGGNAFGSLQVADGATYSAPNAPVHLNSGGGVGIQGGDATLGHVLQEGGVLSFNSGTLSYLGDLVVGTGGLLETFLTSDLTLLADRHLTLSGTTTVDALRTLTLDGGTLNTGSLVVNGTLSITGGTLGSSSGGVLPVDGNGLVQAGGSVNAAIVGSSPALTIRIIAFGVSLGDATTFSGFSHEGTFDVGANSVTLNCAGYARLGILTQLAGGTINATNGVAFATGSNFLGRGAVNARVSGDAGSVIEADGALTLGDAASPAGFNFGGELRARQHTVTLRSSAQAGLGNLAILGDGASPGALVAANGLVVDFNEAIIGFGTISSTNTLAKRTIVNGTAQGTSITQPLTFTGYVKGVGTFNNVSLVGTFSPGLSTSILTVGNIALAPGSALVIELGGTAPGSGYDQIQASGTLALNGALDVSLINGFTPSAGQSFDILDWGSLTGTFSSINLPSLAGLNWNTNQLYTTGVLSVSSLGLPGDYNHNGTVDAADYVVWRNTLGETGADLAADGNGDDVIDADDYDLWRANFGQTAGSGSAIPSAETLSAAVPETATLVLLLSGLAAIALNRAVRSKTKSS